MNKKIKKGFIAIVSIILISYLPILNKEILRVIDADYFRYSNANGSYTYIQKFHFKSKMIDPELINYFIYNSNNNITAENKILYRIYKINYLCFWRWTYYYYCSRKFEYRNWSEIEKNRVPFNSTQPQKFQKF